MGENRQARGRDDNNKCHSAVLVHTYFQSVTIVIPYRQPKQQNYEIMKPSSMNVNRPVYTKSRTTKRKRPTRLHGAFKGGFSAGHFNTVGSKNGWTANDDEIDDEKSQEGDTGDYYSRPVWRPKARTGARLSSKKESKKQKVEDYMDEEDANEWGGPSTVRKDYLDAFGDEKNNSATKLDSSDSLGGLLTRNSNLQGNGSIGKQLLRVLGWREKADDTRSGTSSQEGISYVYVPFEKDENLDHQSNGFLASKRLRRIELKLSKQKKKLPQPKTDTYGLGYEPFQNAPEFKAYKELRKKRAEMRAMAAVSSHGDDRMNVYRTSALTSLHDDEPEDEGFTGSRRGGQKDTKEVRSGESHGDILTYETAEDFVGSKSSGGFALHDDDDDVYDDTMRNVNGKTYDGAKSSKPIIDRGDYHNEIYDASDSDAEGSHLNNDTAKRNGDNVNIFAGALSAWATGTSKSGNSSTGGKNVIAVTSDGRPPMDGFVIGGDGNKLKITRFPGPAIPPNFVAKTHKFPQVDAIDRMKALSSNMKLQMSSRRRAMTAESSIPVRPYRIESVRDTKPMAGGSFAALSSTLKHRFTTSSSKSNDDIKDPEILSPTDPTKIIPLRTTFAWQPAVLLCKRFDISVPRVANTDSKPSSQIKKSAETREETFFRQEVLQKIDPASKSAKQADGTREHMLSEEIIDVERPTMEFMKSIFEPGSDDDMSISEDESGDEKEEETFVESKDENGFEKIGDSYGIDLVKDTVEKKEEHVNIQADNSAERGKIEGGKDDHRMPSSESDSDESGRRKRRHRKERRRHRKHRKDRKSERRKKKKRSS